MGTDCLFGFKHDGKYFLAYNHSDGYPDGGMGGRIAYQMNEILRMNQLPGTLEQVKNLKIVTNKVRPTEEDIEKLKPYTNLLVSEQSTSDWYCLTRKCQGSLVAILKSGYLLLESQDPTESGCFGYVVNFDDNSLDFYESRQLKESFPLTLGNLPNWQWNEEGWLRSMAQIEAMQEEMARSMSMFGKGAGGKFPF